MGFRDSPTHVDFFVVNMWFIYCSYVVTDDGYYMLNDGYRWLAG
jgi:hypothetical protein